VTHHLKWSNTRLRLRLYETPLIDNDRELPCNSIAVSFLYRPALLPHMQCRSAPFDGNFTMSWHSKQLSSFITLWYSTRRHIPLPSAHPARNKTHSSRQWIATRYGYVQTETGAHTNAFGFIGFAALTLERINHTRAIVCCQLHDKNRGASDTWEFTCALSELPNVTVV